MQNKNSLIIFAILIATIYFTLQVITIGSRDIPVTYWAPKEEGCIIEISIAKEFIKDFFAYFGYGDGKIDVQFFKR